MLYEVITRHSIPLTEIKMEELKAIAMIELNSIAKGVAVGDEMLKAASVDLVFAQTICAGKYMVMVSGDVDSVQRASERNNFV